MVRTTRITVETETLLIIRRAKADLAWCPECRAEVDAITLGNDSLAESISVAQIQEWFDTSKLHFWRSANRLPQICVPSLLQCFESEQARRICRCIENPLVQSRRKQK
jgi:hypothetical protein